MISDQYTLYTLSLMKTGKAAGPSGVTADLLMTLGKEFVTRLWEIANRLLKVEFQIAEK